MTDFIQRHYGKLIAFLTGWAADALLDLSGLIKSVLPQLGYIRFVHLCWKAYNGDVGAALEVMATLREKFGL